MDQFERQFEHLDVQTQTMDEAMSGVTTLTTPEVLFLTLTLTFPHTIVCLIRGHVGTRTIDRTVVVVVSILYFCLGPS